IRELTKLVQSQERVEKSTDKMSKAQKGAGAEMDGVSRKAADLGKAALSAAGAFASFEGAKAFVEALNAELKQTLTLSDEAVKSMVSFSTQIANDPQAGDILRATRERGAGHGLT